MINILIVIVIFVVIIIFKMYRLQEEINIIIEGTLLSGLCFYLSRNIEVNYLSNIFNVLSVICILMILVLEIYQYIKKIVNQR